MRRRGITLLELTIIIAILLAFLSILFIGTRAWQRHSDRSSCLLSLRNVQQAARSYQNLYGYTYGGRPYVENGTQNIAAHLYAKGYIDQLLYNQARGKERCPTGGTYICPTPDIFPKSGALYMTCSLSASDKHVPRSENNW